ncbi:hypothetical protein SAMN04489760_14715 [Syntrophus gentianae]|uniref:Uncharacterized protein n=1 Tax=Syntrophus gentianae TaxID=43775 RepID=A0A1H8B6M1_9BACT|nr:hypothetical protein SAMN04489760_14715 [Syntrophus gentianae]
MEDHPGSNGDRERHSRDVSRSFKRNTKHFRISDPLQSVANRGKPLRRKTDCKIIVVFHFSKDFFQSNLVNVCGSVTRMHFTTLEGPVFLGENTADQVSFMICSKDFFALILPFIPPKIPKSHIILNTSEAKTASSVTRTHSNPPEGPASF